MAVRPLSVSDTSSTRSSHSVRRVPNRCLNPQTGKGHVIFTGPDGNSDYRARILSPDYIGFRDQPREHTDNLSYLWRAARSTPFPRSRRCMTGEIGCHSIGSMDKQLLQSKHQITLGEFRSQCEDRYTHRYQNPWYPQKSRSKSHLDGRFWRDDSPDDLMQVPIRQASRSKSSIASPTISYQYKRKSPRPMSPGSSSNTSYGEGI